MAAAYAALASLMHTIHEIQRHHAPPITLDKQQVQSLTQNITFLQGFLESYVPPVSVDELADPLEMSIADAAYAAEDVIESHIVDTIQLQSSRPKLTRLFNCIHPRRKIVQQIKSMNFNQNLQQVIGGMDSVKLTAMSIDTEKKVVPTTDAATSSTFSTGPNSSTTVVVGFEDASLQIMEKLTENRPDRQIVPIVGMGGIGKTTLARYVFEQKLTKERFYICAWATISQQHNTREILCEVYSQVTKKDEEQLSVMSKDELGLELHKCLFGRRFLIVMDDMWSIDAWNEIQPFFPNNQNGSRILVTTRLLELSSHLNNDYIQQVGFLDEASSWDLFSKVVFGENNVCPREMKKIAKKISNGCRGLPLSIVVVGGLLKKMDATQQCWEPILSNLNSVVNMDNNKHCWRLLRMSYNHLPVHLKPCFLYMGVFKEDVQIRVSTIVKLWISEGFLKQMNGESSKTSARRFLKELVDRNLILISKLGSTGNIKSCKIHDLLRDLCLKEGLREGFYHVIGQRSPRCINSQRRVVVPSNASERKVLDDLQSMTHARSVIFEKGRAPQCLNLGLLKTFHIYETDYEGRDISYPRSFSLQLVNVRHITIGCTDMSSFLSSASLLWNLHTIIVNDDWLSFSKHPLLNIFIELVYDCCGWRGHSNTITEFWKMPQLRHIEFVNQTLHLPDPSNDGTIMENLQVLKGVTNFKCCREVVKRIPNIKKLEVYFTKKL